MKKSILISTACVMAAFAFVSHPQANAQFEGTGHRVGDLESRTADLESHTADLDKRVRDLEGQIRDLRHCVDDLNRR